MLHAEPADGATGLPPVDRGGVELAAGRSPVSPSSAPMARAPPASLWPPGGVFLDQVLHSMPPEVLEGVSSAGGDAHPHVLEQRRQADVVTVQDEIRRQ